MFLNWIILCSLIAVESIINGIMIIVIIYNWFLNRMNIVSINNDRVIISNIFNNTHCLGHGYPGLCYVTTTINCNIVAVSELQLIWRDYSTLFFMVMSSQVRHLV